MSGEGIFLKTLGLAGRTEGKKIIKTNMSVAERVTTLAKSNAVKEGMDKAYAASVSSSKNPVLKHMTSGSSVFGSDAKGAQSLGHARGAIERYRATSGMYNRNMDNLASRMETMAESGGRDSEAYKALEAQYNTYANERNSATRLMGAGWDTAKGAWGYLNSGTLMQRAAKFGTVGAGYVGAAGLVRGMTGGGGMFYNSDGQRDIAGIPFV